MPESLRVHYRLHCARGESAEDKAVGIALEQTVELPARCVPANILTNFSGQLELLEQRADSIWEAVIAYAPDLVGGELTQLLNLLFGNISLKNGILVSAIEWPQSLLDHFGGPGTGIDGLRALTQVPAGLPLTCTALKPVGSRAETLADLAYRFALGGVDIIKDDHGIADQPTAPFTDRLAACQAAVERANQQSGGGSQYFPNATASPAKLPERLAAARDAGCRGVLLSPWLCGLDSLALARDHYGLAVMAHPALTGSYFMPHHGLTPELVLGDLFRVAGADASIYPNTGGRFGFSQETCEAINARLRGPLGGLKRAAPTPGGGMDVKRAPHWIRNYGPDTIVLIGGSLYVQGDVTDAARDLLQALGR
ncbi:MAG: RuBisCO large subunit C-terminal-like domain-containing protein [Aquisalimonadaceae bacterium]